MTGRRGRRSVVIVESNERKTSTRMIAAELVISPKTVGAHLEHVYAKLGVSNRAMAGLFAAKHGLISVDDS
jgi:DNA-binding NarL/FixJ family response regulator